MNRRTSLATGEELKQVFGSPGDRAATREIGRSSYRRNLNYAICEIDFQNGAYASSSDSDDVFHFQTNQFAVLDARCPGK